MQCERLLSSHTSSDTHWVTGRLVRGSKQYYQHLMKKKRTLLKLISKVRLSHMFWPTKCVFAFCTHKRSHLRLAGRIAASFLSIIMICFVGFIEFNAPFFFFFLLTDCSSHSDKALLFLCSYFHI